MTYEKRIVVSLTDIHLISYECKACRAKVSFSPDKALPPAGNCFQCKSEWVKDRTEYESPGNYAGVMRQPPVSKLTAAIAAIRNPDIEAVHGFRVLLEFEEPSMRSVFQTSEPGR
jgi:hypothetical protein